VKELSNGPVQALGIESEIREVLTNLVFNAVDAMPQGGTLTLRTVASPDQARLEVQDTGVGMDEATRRKCLEPFFTTKGERGTGLGLAMVYGIVQRHNANLQIDSEPGRGTRIGILFPVARVIPARTADTIAVSAPVRPLRLLLIDDDPAVLKSLSEILQAEDHRVVALADPRQAVALFRSSQASEPFDVVITDLGMPHLDGRAVAKAVKECSAQTPVILLTGWGPRSGAHGETVPHVDRVLGKPPKMRELRAALGECCSDSAVRLATAQGA
jgi:CheY-like chemotaxis protein/anti-sigma regulatory factor (Ser/Thr protein kinase)